MLATFPFFHAILSLSLSLSLSLYLSAYIFSYHARQPIPFLGTKTENGRPSPDIQLCRPKLNDLSYKRL